MTHPTPSSERAPYRCIKPHCPARCDDCNHAIRSDNEAAMLVTDMLNVLAFDDFGLPYEEGDCLIVDKARAWLARASLPAPTCEHLFGIDQSSGYGSTVAVCLRCGHRPSMVVQPAPAPTGWQMVPVEPTPEMLDKGAMEIAMNRQRVQTAESGAHHVFRAMLSAAPSQDEGKTK